MSWVRKMNMGHNKNNPPTTATLWQEINEKLIYGRETTVCRCNQWSQKSVISPHISLFCQLIRQGFCPCSVLPQGLWNAVSGDCIPLAFWCQSPWGVHDPSWPERGLSCLHQHQCPAREDVQSVYHFHTSWIPTCPVSHPTEPAELPVLVTSDQE